MVESGLCVVESGLCVVESGLKRIKTMLNQIKQCDMKSISEILKNAREDFIIGKYECMCVAISRNCEGNNVGEQWEWMKHNIALFNRKIAIEKFNAFDQGMYWWDKWDRDERIRYFDWLIERYMDPVGVEYYPACGDYYPDI